MTAITTASVVPDPAYMLVPFATTLGGLISALNAWVNERRPDWGRAWVHGNVWGGLIGAAVVILLYAAGVD
jgi:hypothetical protein